MQRMAFSRGRVMDPLRTVGAFCAFMVRQFVRDQGPLTAAALTYTTLFAVVPMMTVTYAMLASIPSFQGVGEQLEGLIFDHFVPDSGETMRSYLTQFAAQARALTAVGVGFLVVTAYLMLKSIESAFNRIWQVVEPRRGISSFLLYWAVLSLGPLLLGLGFVLSSYVASLPLISGATEVLGAERLLSALAVLASATAFTLLYAAVPNCHVPLRHACVGGVAVALVFEAAKFSFTLFVTHFPSYKLIYGAFAAFPLFLAWIYISWMIVLLGAELVRGLGAFRQAGHSQPVDLVSVLEVLYQLWEAQKRGQTLTEQQLLAALPRLNHPGWEQLWPVLKRLSLVEQSASGGYLLSRDLKAVSLWSLYRRLPWPLPDPTALSEPRFAWQSALQQRFQQAETQLRDSLDLGVATLFEQRASQRSPAQCNEEDL